MKIRTAAISAGSLALGTGLGYYLDADRGRARRAELGNALAHQARRAGHQVVVAGRRGLNLARGLAAEAGWHLAPEEVPDEVLVERVRARLGHVVRHRHQIEVAAQRGVVQLSGRALPSDVDALLEAVTRVHGVKQVENRLDLHGWQEPGPDGTSPPPAPADLVGSDG